MIRVLTLGVVLVSVLALALSACEGSGEAEQHYDAGLALQEQGNLEEAIFHFETAIKIDPRFAQSHKNLGIALTKLGKTEEAEIHFQAARELKEKTNPGETR